MKDRQTMTFTRLLAAALIAGSTTLAMNAPAISAPLVRDSGLNSAATQNGAEQVQYRRYHGGHHHGGYRRGGGGGGALIGGLAAGAIIGGAIAASQAQAAANERHAYCAQRFRSYDPGSGTYIGRGGQRYYCQ
jgi:hypothetical protein